MGFSLSLDGFYDYLQHQQGIGGGTEIILGGTTGNMANQAGGSTDRDTYLENQKKNLENSYDAHGNKIKNSNYSDYLKKKCDQEGANYDDVVAQIAYESGGNPNAKNKGGYKGLFQIGTKEAAAAGINPYDEKQSIDWYFQNRRKNINYRKKRGVQGGGSLPPAGGGSNMANSSSTTRNSTSEIVNKENPIPLADESKIYAANANQLDFNIADNGNVYQNNLIDFRLGNSYSNLQKVGNKIADPNIKGAPAIFNDYALFRFYGINDANALFDRIGNESSSNKRYAGANWQNPTAAALIEWGDQQGNRQFPYNWTDFIYCKYYGLITNNHLITLRRYPLPTYDHGLVSSAEHKGGKTYEAGKRSDAYQLPAAQAVTWLSDQTENTLDKLLTFTVGQNWEEKTADVNSIEPENRDGNDQFGEGSGLAKFSQMLGVLTGKATTSTLSGEQNQLNKFDPYEGPNAPLKYKIYGPVNVIDKTYVRQRGLNFSQTFELKFHYSLNSIGQINPKMAMLDILSNLLSLTYNNAKFWGGANRFFPNTPRYPFLGSQQMWFDAKPGAWISTVMDQFKDAASSVGDFFSLFSGNPSDALKKLIGGGASMMMANMVGKKERPTMLSIPALLTGQPVGEWHLTVGNPLNPIAMIGNLIVEGDDGMKIEFNNTLGADDFPTEMTATIQLKHGRPRDKGDIESMFNQGQGRLYYAYENQMEPWNRASSTRNSENSTYGKYSTDGGQSWKAVGNLNENGTIVASNSGDKSLNSMLAYSKEFGSDIGNSFYASKSYSSKDMFDKKAYVNAVDDGGGTD